jgi:hypothetical protein
MDPFAKLTFGISPEQLPEITHGIGVLFLAKIILPDIKQALLHPWRGEKV